MQGYIKLWRKSLDSVVWQNPDIWRFWTWCLMKATHKPTRQMVGFQEVDLEPGQFVFGRNMAVAETGLSERKIRTAIDSLRKRKKVTIKTTNKFSVISIVKWADYQEEATSKTTNNRPATVQQPSTNNNDKNGKNIKEIYKEKLESFKVEVMAHSEYPTSMLEDFLRYWGEPNQAKTRLRWEMEKTWSLAGRLAYWSKRSNVPKEGPKREEIY